VSRFIAVLGFKRNNFIKYFNRRTVFIINYKI